MKPRLKTYEKKNESFASSKSVLAINNLFAKNLSRRKVQNGIPLIRELPKRNSEMQDDSAEWLHVNHNDTFDKLLNGEAYNEIDFIQKSKTKSSISESSQEISLQTEKRTNNRKVRACRKVITEKSSTFDTFDIPVTESLEVEYENPNKCSSSAIFNVSSSPAKKFNSTNIFNNSRFNFTPTTYVREKRLICESPLSPIPINDRKRLIEESLKEINSWGHKKPRFPEENLPVGNLEMKESTSKLNSDKTNVRKSKRKRKTKNEKSPTQKWYSYEASSENFNDFENEIYSNNNRSKIMTRSKTKLLENSNEDSFYNLSIIPTRRKRRKSYTIKRIQYLSENNLSITRSRSSIDLNNEKKKENKKSRSRSMTRGRRSTLNETENFTRSSSRSIFQESEGIPRSVVTERSSLNETENVSRNTRSKSSLGFRIQSYTKYFADDDDDEDYSFDVLGQSSKDYQLKESEQKNISEKHLDRLNECAKVSKVIDDGNSDEELSQINWSNSNDDKSVSNVSYSGVLTRSKSRLEQSLNASKRSKSNIDYNNSDRLSLNRSKSVNSISKKLDKNKLDVKIEDKNRKSKQKFSLSRENNNQPAEERFSISPNIIYKNYQTISSTENSVIEESLPEASSCHLTCNNRAETRVKRFNSIGNNIQDSEENESTSSTVRTDQHDTLNRKNSTESLLSNLDLDLYIRDSSSESASNSPCDTPNRIITPFILIESTKEDTENNVSSSKNVHTNDSNCIVDSNYLETSSLNIGSTNDSQIISNNNRKTLQSNKRLLDIITECKKPFRTFSSSTPRKETIETIDLTSTDIAFQMSRIESEADKVPDRPQSVLSSRSNSVISISSKEDDDINVDLNENESVIPISSTITEQSCNSVFDSFASPSHRIHGIKHGKKWLRSLSKYRRSMALQNTNEVCASPSHGDQLEKYSLCRKSRYISNIPIPKTPTRLSVIQSYACSPELGYVSNSIRGSDTLEKLGNLSLNAVTNRTSISSTETFATARDIVLLKCGQAEPFPFSQCYPDQLLKNCQKIGEGVYGEVFLFRNTRGGTTVMKIIPIEGRLPVNGEPQKKFKEILSEIVIALELSALRNNKKNSTGGFNEVQSIKCVKGKYPERLIELWDLYQETRISENDCPDIFQEDQLYIILELSNGGKDLESFEFNNSKQAYSLFQQTACSLAVAEIALQFEHRDLHWGNILISSVDKKKKLTYNINGRQINVPSNGIQVSIIDFTLSRISYDNVCIYNDLAQDTDLFTAEGDYQFEIYRLMRKHNGDDWQQFVPYTNVLWLHYILDKLIEGVRYKYSTSKIHEIYIGELSKLKDEILKHESVEEFVMATFV